MTNSNESSVPERGDAEAASSDQGGGGHGIDGSRRTFLAGVGAVGAGAATAGCLSAPEGSVSSGGFDRIPPEENTEWGETVQLGDGEVRTFVTIDGDDKMVGAEMTPGALNASSLPTQHVLFSVPIPDSDEHPFVFLGLDWEPGGHYPGDKYAIPHWDFHFYFIPESEVAEIPRIGLPPDDDEYTRPLADDMIPENYFRTNYTFPYMGEHLYNETAPQYNGGTFANTYVYGHWDGNLHFMEPMITVPYFEQLMENSDDPELPQLEDVDHVDRRELFQPEAFPEAGEYPTEYAVRYHPDRDVFTITQHNFQEFPETEGSPPAENTTTEQTTNADATVVVGPDAALVFEPAELEISTGDTVEFTWDSDFHNVVPESKPSDSSWKGEPEISNTGHSHTHTFEVAGTYEYFCEPHKSQGMTGTITVTDG